MADERQLAMAELERRGVDPFAGTGITNDPLVELLLQGITGAGATIVGGLAGIAGLPFGIDAAANAVRRTQEALTYQPRSKQTQEFGQAVGELMAPIEQGKQWLGDKAYEATGSPLAATIASVAPEIIEAALGLRAAKGLGGQQYEIGDIGGQASKFGGRQRGIFAGIKAKGADLDAMKAAQELEARGVPRETIWQETGWFQDVDGNWKWEIDDSNARFALGGFDVDEYGSQEAGLYDALIHPELQGNYPEAGGVRVVHYPDEGYQGASFSPADNEIILGQQAMQQGKSVPLHETQHAIQERENFARGGSSDATYIDPAILDVKATLDDLASAQMLARMRGGEDRFKMMTGKEPSDTQKWLAKTFTPEYLTQQRQLMKVRDNFDLSKRLAMDKFKRGEITADQFYKATEITPKEIQYEMYKRLAGEAEARNVQTRMNWTPEQRRQTPPWASLDVPEDELIIKR